jgi:histidinol-phosphatase (PHP family)
MAWKNRMDLHTHTDNSFDGHHSAALLCETAEAAGLRAVAFTDHVEMDAYREKQFDRTAKQSYFETIKARSAFRGKLIVCAGVELGQPHYAAEEAEALLKQLKYDIVIGSVHNLRGQEDFWFLPYQGYDDGTVAALLREYFDEVLALAQWGKFDTLAHLTYPLRYICGEHRRTVKLSDYKKQIDAILETLVKKGIALELNTSGLRQKLGKVLPEESIVRRFRKLGGEHITLGSDAHFAEHLGNGLETGMELAQRCGFTHMTLYQHREPLAIAIE